MSHTSSKLIELGSTAFRQPRAESHCKYIHGYQLKAEINFACNELDKNNWVFDFGGLKDLKYIFRNQFDHTLVVAGDDPFINEFQELDKKGVVQLRIMPGGVGIERFAEWCFKTADTFVEEVTEGRVWVESVTVYEHDENFASYNRSRSPVVEKQATEEKKDVQEQPTETTGTAPNPRSARVGPNVTQGNFSDPFAGTTWGNK
jgi:6-pyruvoyltetrahydropterin/6-carboxytetrahydropterin synthase